MIYDGKRVGKCILVRFILSLVILDFSRFDLTD